MLILIIIGSVIGAAIYFNLGHYFSEKYRDAHHEDFGSWDFIQRFQMGPEEMWLADTNKDPVGYDTGVIISYILWPAAIVLTLAFWILYHIFFGGLYKLIKKK